MAIHAITGVMGSGKSYEAVSQKIVPFLKNEKGSRVVTNIEGLNLEEFSRFTGLSLEELEQRLIRVSYERVAEPKFWYDPENEQTDTVVQPGDRVVLDEVWRYFNRDMKIPPDAMRFFRMHRHYVNETSGLTCEVVLINQTMAGIHKDVSGVVEAQFKCRKLKALGMANVYEVLLYEGGERKASHSFVRKYDSRVFPLYSSYNTSSESVKEAIDKRQSIFSTPLFKYVLPLFICVSGYSSWWVYEYFTTMGKTEETEKQKEEAGTEEKPKAAPTTTTTAAPVAAVSNEEWRLVAMYNVGGVPVALVVDEKGRYRSVTSMAVSRGASNDVTVELEKGVKATPHAGNTPTYNQRTERGQQ